jgi:pimeloyl-ACP methyl ester carboxylesterase
LIADISPFTYENVNHLADSQHSVILNAVLSLDLKSMTSRIDAETLLKEKIPSENIRNLILKNLKRTSDNTFVWKINATSLLKNLDKILEGIKRPTDFNQQITGFPVIFLRGGDSDYIPKADFRDIQHIFPAAEIIEIPGAGHWIQVDKPEEVIKYIKRLLVEN